MPRIKKVKLPPIENRYLPVKHETDLPYKKLLYEYAEDFIRQIDLSVTTHAITSGTFVLGDAIEALIVNKKLEVKKMTIYSLSLNDVNIDSLKDLMTNEYVDEVNLVLSVWYYANNNKRGGACRANL